MEQVASGDAASSLRFAEDRGREFRCFGFGGARRFAVGDVVADDFEVRLGLPSEGVALKLVEAVSAGKVLEVSGGH